MVYIISSCSEESYVLSTLIILIKRFIRSLSPAVDKLADDEGNDDSYHENSQGYPDSDWYNLTAISTIKTISNCRKKVAITDRLLYYTDDV